VTATVGPTWDDGVGSASGLVVDEALPAGVREAVSEFEAETGNADSGLLPAVGVGACLVNQSTANGRPPRTVAREGTSTGDGSHSAVDGNRGGGGRPREPRLSGHSHTGSPRRSRGGTLSPVRASSKRS